MVFLFLSLKIDLFKIIKRDTKAIDTTSKFMIGMVKVKGKMLPDELSGEGVFFDQSKYLIE